MRAGIFTKTFAKELYRKTQKDRVTNGAAALAFYWLLAVFPAAIFTLTLLPYLPIPRLEQAIMDLLHDVMPGEAARMFEDTVRKIVSSRQAGLLSFGFVFTLWTASSGVYAVMEELNNVHDTEDSRPFWKARGIAILLTFAVLLLVLGSLALAILGGAIQDWLGNALGFSAALLFFFAALRWAIIGLALLAALALVYRFGPAQRLRERFTLFTAGTVAGTVILAIASVGFNLYVSHFGSYDATYGSLGAVIALLMWLFVTGLVLLVGAEIDVLVARRRGRSPGPAGARLSAPDRNDAPSRGARGAQPA